MTPQQQSEAVRKFIEDVIALGKERGLSLGHEDEHGNFTVVPYQDLYADWLRGADDATAVLP